MIYIAIDHINGEFDRVLDNLFTEKQALELKKYGYIIIQINIISKEVKVF